MHGTEEKMKNFNMMKKLLALTLGAAMLLAVMTGCGKKDTPQEPADDQQQQQEEQQPAEPATLLEQIKAKGVNIGYVTLHVGLGTFRPVKAEEVLEHHMHSELCMMNEQTARILNETKASGGRIVCVGTTSCRTLESLVNDDGTFEAKSRWTDIFIYPGYQFKAMDALITNFHLPESTLIMLVSALAGREHVLAAYEEAVRERYRFFSFGDAMFIS